MGLAISVGSLSGKYLGKNQKYTVAEKKMLILCGGLGEKA